MVIRFVFQCGEVYVKFFYWMREEQIEALKQHIQKRISDDTDIKYAEPAEFLKTVLKEFGVHFKIIRHDEMIYVR